MHPNRMFVVAVVLASYVVVSLPAASQVHETQPVLVVNGSRQPVPTAAQGVTDISGTVNLSSGSTVNIGNTPSVNVANTPSVNVANTPTVSLAAGAGVNVTNPLDSQNNPMPLATLEAAQPYEDFCIMEINGYGYGDCSFQAIPAGKRLVIQEFDAWGALLTGSKPAFLYLTTHPGFHHYFTATFMDAGFGADNFATHQETRLYQFQNITPVCSVGVTIPGGSYTCDISGFLVDVP